MKNCDNVALLERARLVRAEAARARRLSVWVIDKPSLKRLLAYAIEQDQCAAEYERLAAARGTLPPTEELQAAIEQVGDTVNPKKGE